MCNIHHRGQKVQKVNKKMILTNSIMKILGKHLCTHQHSYTFQSPEWRLHITMYMPSP